ncbi:class II glutamine amidotransferase [Pseudoalteromonas sp. S16_S37]|nr:class II glutamine amidotransferase [Pseudoalteromonas sp. S16_S37]
MCRFIIYKGSAITMNNLVIKPANSLIVQSKTAKKRAKPVNGDGFGVSWYPLHNDPEPARIVSIEPAWSNQNLIQLTSKVNSKHFFAHVRDASVDMPVSQSNCHPFTSGRYMFMHNGRLDQFPKFKRSILNSLSDKAFNLIKGNTDSEYAFALFMDTIDFCDNLSAEELKLALYETIRRIMQFRVDNGANTNAFINFAVSDGISTVATRFATDANSQPASLFYTQGTFGYEQLADDITVNHESNGDIIICSEPLTETSEGWIKVARNHAIIVDSNNSVTVDAIPIPFQS